MRSFRDIQAIVQDYPPAPDGEDLRRLCERHLEHVGNVMDITDWIKHDTPNPYLRELYATQTALLLKEHCEEDNWQAAACEEAIDALALIARQASRTLFDKLCQFLPVPFSYRNFTKYRH